MGFFSNLFKSTGDIKQEIEGLKKAQEVLDQRFQKHQIANDLYVKKSLEYREKIEKLESKLPDED